jgi:Xaa-Pro dipeptidase
VALTPDARFFVADGLARALEPGRVHSGAAVVRQLRGVKEPEELALLERAAELTQRALARVAEIVSPGTSAAEVGALAARAQQLLGLASPWVLPLVDAAAALPHGDHGGEILQPSSVLLVDTGGSLCGYQSDITRTWVVGGRASSEVERAWHAVRDAQRRAFEVVRPGATGSEVDRVARAAIEAAGYGAGYAAMTHRLGHGIGLEGHEEPYFDGGNALPLEAGNVITDEPGIYLAGAFGVRIEDMLAVTESGARAFGAWQSSPSRP